MSSKYSTFDNIKHTYRHPVLANIHECNKQSCGSGSVIIFPPGSAFNMRIRIQEGNDLRGKTKTIQENWYQYRNINIIFKNLSKFGPVPWFLTLEQFFVISTTVNSS